MDTCSNNDDTDLVYIASAFAGDAKRSRGDWWPWYTDTHVEVVLPLALAFHFEAPDSPARDRLEARIEKIVSGWLNPQCAAVSSTPRLFNWQHRSNAVRTWQWVKDPENDGGDTGSIPQAPSDLEVQ